MGKFSTTVLALSLTLLAGGAAAANKGGAKASAKPMGAKEIRNCMAKNLVSRGVLRDLALDVFDKEGKISSLRMRLYWKPSKTGGTRVHLRMVDPPAMAVGV